MANFITIFRVILMFIGVYLLCANSHDGGITSRAAGIWVLILTIVVFALDGLDGYIARKFNEASKLGALLDIMGDRIVENTYWILFAVNGWISVLFPLIAITRGFITDTIRSAAMEQGFTAFGEHTMQKNPVCIFITSSKFMRISYAVAKVAAFVVIITSKIPDCPYAELVFSIGYWLAAAAIVFCIIRGLPVVIEAKYLFNKNEQN